MVDDFDSFYNKHIESFRKKFQELDINRDPNTGLTEIVQRSMANALNNDLRIFQRFLYEYFVIHLTAESKKCDTLNEGERESLNKEQEKFTKREELKSYRILLAQAYDLSSKYTLYKPDREFGDIGLPRFLRPLDLPDTIKKEIDEVNRLLGDLL